MAVRGGWLFILLLTTITLYDLGRSFLPPAGGAALFVEPGVYIELRDNLHRLDGIHQITDAAEILGVIKMADLEFAPHLTAEDLGRLQPIAGKLYEFKVVGEKIVSIEAKWMSAAGRMALGLPLRVGRMNTADWADLPGAGPELARRISQFRQISGDNMEFDDLLKVNGVGKKRLEAWRPYFLNSLTR